MTKTVNGKTEKNERNRQAAAWLSGVLSEPFEPLSFPETEKYLILLYQDLSDIYGEITGSSQTEQLWKDFLTDTCDRTMLLFLPDPKNRSVLMQTVLRHLFLLRGTDIPEYFRLLSESKRYRTYFDGCFSPEEEKPRQFFRYLASSDRGKTKALTREFLDCFRRFSAFFIYYLFQETSTEHFLWTEPADRRLRRIEALIPSVRSLPAPDPEGLRNPICGTGEFPGKNIFNFYRVIFHMEGGQSMIEDLYEELKSEDCGQLCPDSILPKSFAGKIRKGILPAYCRVDFEEGRKINYLEHGILYEKQNGDEQKPSFSKSEGKITVTDTDLCFSGEETLRLPLSGIRKTVLYEAVPDIVETAAGDRTFFFLVPEAALLYEVLRLLLKRASGAPLPDGTVSEEEPPEEDFPFFAGTIDESMLTDADRAWVDLLSEEIDFENAAQMAEYGSDAQAAISDFSGSILRKAKEADFQAVGDLLSELADTLSKAAEPEKKDGPGIFRKPADFEKTEDDITRMEKELTRQKERIIRDIAQCRKMYDLNLSVYRKLSLYILAGKKALFRARQNAAGTAEADDRYLRFERKLNDLEISRIISLQMAPQIRLLENNDRAVLERLETSLSHAIPLWRNRMALTLATKYLDKE